MIHSQSYIFYFLEIKNNIIKHKTLRLNFKNKKIMNDIVIFTKTFKEKRKKHSLGASKKKKHLKVFFYQTSAFKNFLSNTRKLFFPLEITFFLEKSAYKHALNILDFTKT